MGGEHTPEICQKLNTLIVAQPMDENVGLTVVGIHIAAVCCTIPSTLIHIKDSGQPIASIFGSRKLYGYAKDMGRDSAGANVKLDNLKSK